MTLTDLLADLNDRLDDTGNTQIAEATKTRYLNHGIRATWPHLYRIVSDETLVIVDDTWEYNIPSAVGQHTKILRVELETESGSGRFRLLDDYQIVPSLTAPILLLEHNTLPAEAGAKIRITSAARLSELSAGSDEYDGPTGTEELPVLYAMGLATQRRLDNRLDYTRYTTTVDENGVGASDIMQASQFFFAQFELLLERHALALPSEQS